MKQPRFSVIIPVYNAEKTIRRCLDSVLKQTCSDYEVILIDDGSTDTTRAILKEYLREIQNERFQLHCQANVGAGETRNRGIALGQGEYLVFLDADDYIDINFLEYVELQIVQHDADLVFVDIVREKDDGQIIRYERMSDWKTIDQELMLRQQLTGKMPWGGVRKVARYSLVRQGNFRFGALKTGEECVYSFDLLRFARSIAFQKEALYHYVDSKTSLTANDQVENSINVYHYLDEHLRKTGNRERYRKTMNAMAATTAVIAINVLAKQQPFFSANRSARSVFREFRDYVREDVDIEALEKRVLICLPFLKLGWISPIILAAKAQDFIRKVGSENE